MRFLECPEWKFEEYSRKVENIRIKEYPVVSSQWMLIAIDLSHAKNIPNAEFQIDIPPFLIAWFPFDGLSINMRRYNWHWRKFPNSKLINKSNLYYRPSTKFSFSIRLTRWLLANSYLVVPVNVARERQSAMAASCGSLDSMFTVRYVGHWWQHGVAVLNACVVLFMHVCMWMHWKRVLYLYEARRSSCVARNGRQHMWKRGIAHSNTLAYRLCTCEWKRHANVAVMLHLCPPIYAM